MTDAPEIRPEIRELTPLSFFPKSVSLSNWALIMPQVSSLLEVSEPTLRGWVSRKQFPPKDGELDGRTPYWKLTTVLEYLRNAPGGRLPYTVGS